MKKILIYTLIITLFVTLSFTNTKPFVQADNPFVTRTVNRYGELVETQDAYEAYTKIKDISYPGGIYNLNNPQDIYIDEDNYIYIADTGNKKILILNDNHEYITSFGDDILHKPTGLFIRDNIIYVADYGLPDDRNSGKVVLYSFDKTTNAITLIEERKCPTSKILEHDKFVYRPTKLSVDANLTLYVVCEGSTNGILTISKENRFMSYFAPNDVEMSFKDRIKYFLYEENEGGEKLKDILPTPCCNVHIDDSGYIYTVTQKITKSDLGDTLKKVNISGSNFYPSTMLTSSEFVSAWSGKYGNVFAATQKGFIYEYDLEGNILFIFAGTEKEISQLGLFKSLSSLAVNQNDLVYALDANDSSIQIFQPTHYTNTVHTALGLYNDGKYAESKVLWEEVLVYNSLLDIAHKGIGLAHYLSGNYEDALEEFTLANDKKNYSEAFWEIRNVWFTSNLGIIFILIVVLLITIFALTYINKHYHIFKKLKDKINLLKKHRFINDFFLMFGMFRHPLNTTYYIKTNKKMSYLHGFIVLCLIFIVYVLGITSTGFIFNHVVIERTILLKEALKIIIPIVLFIVANFLASSLLEGEGTLKATFLCSMASLMPLVVLYPFAIILSNVLTLNESFIYYLVIFIIIAWSVINVLVTNKELHNYSLGKMILNIIMTILLMLILLIAIILIYLMVAQVIEFVKDIIMEVIFNG